MSVLNLGEVAPHYANPLVAITLSVILPFAQDAKAVHPLPRMEAHSVSQSNLVPTTLHAPRNPFGQWVRGYEGRWLRDANRERA